MSSITPLTPEGPYDPGSFSIGGYAGQPEGIDGVGFWPRVAGRVIDLLLHMVVGFVTGFFMAILVAIAAVGSGQTPRHLIAKMTAPSLLAYLLAIVGAFAYMVTCESIHGSTLGKRLLSMVVIQEDGRPCRFKSAVIRNLGYFVDALFFGLIGYSAMNRSPQQQRYGDSWAGTIVCKRAQVAPDNLRGGGRFALALLAGCAVDSTILIVSMLIRLLA